MALNISDADKAALKTALSLLLAGGMRGGAGRVANVAQRMNGVESEPIPANPHMDYGVVYVPGPPQLNQMMPRDAESLASTRLQSDDMHSMLLNKFAGDSRIPPEQAKRLGKVAEQNAPEFWYADEYPRRPITPSSSAVSSVVVDGNNIKIKFGGKSKEYTYRGGRDYRSATEEAAKLITSGSLGRAVNGDWGASHKLY